MGDGKLSTETAERNPATVFRRIGRHRRFPRPEGRTQPSFHVPSRTVRGNRKPLILVKIHLSTNLEASSSCITAKPHGRWTSRSERNEVDETTRLWWVVVHNNTRKQQWRSTSSFFVLLLLSPVFHASPDYRPLKSPPSASLVLGELRLG